jgi:hypothetical protein
LLRESGEPVSVIGHLDDWEQVVKPILKERFLFLIIIWRRMKVKPGFCSIVVLLAVLAAKMGQAVPAFITGIGFPCDFLWNDTNQNGIQDTGEPVVNGV